MWTRGRKGARVGGFLAGSRASAAVHDWLAGQFRDNPIDRDLLMSVNSGRRPIVQKQVPAKVTVCIESGNFRGLIGILRLDKYSGSVGCGITLPRRMLYEDSNDSYQQVDTNCSFNEIPDKSHYRNLRLLNHSMHCHVSSLRYRYIYQACYNLNRMPRGGLEPMAYLLSKEPLFPSMSYGGTNRSKE